MDNRLMNGLLQKNFLNNCFRSNNNMQSYASPVIMLLKCLAVKCPELKNSFML